VIHYTINAGQLEPGSWYARADTEGSRFVAEGCHFVDTASWWLDSEPVEVFATRTPDDQNNLLAILLFADGSVAMIACLTKGDVKYPKEMMEVFGEKK